MRQPDGSFRFLFDKSDYWIFGFDLVFPDRWLPSLSLGLGRWVLVVGWEEKADPNTGQDFSDAETWS